MQILVNEKNEIVNYVTVGSVSMEGHETIEISELEIPELFMDLYKPGLFIYQDNKISVNPNYNEYQEEQLEDMEINDREMLKRHQKEIDHLYEYHQLAKPDI
ncbi:DUF2977 domain-containing protein [Staphylococcus xylosus]|uniref:DUF2977 domain-containing protein n=1 Tax=Staphylococcus xylosus TaxID=1288 RepID=UPI000E68921B|nr:DUF2977 domain-containing protein [Staphylococcus xylosus]RIM88317.1 DUF2977 domain-containing protein [Staphylococcus xylosus]